MLDIIVTCVNRPLELVYWTIHSSHLFRELPSLRRLLIVNSDHIQVFSNTSLDILRNHSSIISPTKYFFRRRPTRELPFSKSFYLRLGYLYSISDYLFFLDSDIRILPHDINHLFGYLRNSIFSAVYLDKVYEASDPHRNAIHFGYMPVITPLSSSLSRITIEPWTSIGCRPGFGNLLVKRTAYLDAGLHDLNYDSYGWEDHDLITSLQLNDHLVARSGHAFHCTSENHINSSSIQTRSDSLERMRQLYLLKYSSYINAKTS